MQKASTEKLISDLQAVVHDAEQLLHATAGNAGDKIAAARAKAEESVRAAKKRIAEVEEEVVERAQELVDDADKYVRRNPWQAIGIAAAAGLLVGLVISRR